MSNRMCRSLREVYYYFYEPITHYAHALTSIKFLRYLTFGSNVEAWLLSLELIFM